MNEPVFSPDIQRRIWRWEQSTDMGIEELHRAQR